MGLLKTIAGLFASKEEEEAAKDLGRNDDCWCGSGRKYKRCHLDDDTQKLRRRHILNCGKT